MKPLTNWLIKRVETTVTEIDNTSEYENKISKGGKKCAYNETLEYVKRLVNEPIEVDKIELEDYQYTQPEKILCAAIMFNGSIITGYRHLDCYKTLKNLLGKFVTPEDFNVGREDQGFLTSYDRYVDRREAWKIAKANNQIVLGPSEGDDCELISENLY